MRPAARPAMEEEEEAIGYLDKVLEDEDDSEPGTPTSPVSPFSAGDKVGSGGTLPRAGHWVWGQGAFRWCWRCPGVGTAPGAMRWVLAGGRAGSGGSITAAPPQPRDCLCQGTGHGCARLQPWGAQGGVTTQLCFQGGAEPHVLRGASCGAQQGRPDAQEGAGFTL